MASGGRVPSRRLTDDWVDRRRVLWGCRRSIGVFFGEDLAILAEESLDPELVAVGALCPRLMSIAAFQRTVVQPSLQVAESVLHRSSQTAGCLLVETFQMKLVESNLQ